MKKEIIDNCIGCDRIIEDKYCSAYSDPTSKWGMGRCNFTTIPSDKVFREKNKTNPIKISKKMRRIKGRK